MKKNKIYQLITFIIILVLCSPLVVQADDIPVLGYGLDNSEVGNYGKTFVIDRENSILFAERYKTIHLHAGEHGYFETSTGHQTTIDSIQFKGDSFEERREPVPNDVSYHFLGWATTPDASTPDISVGGTNTSMIGDDVYAVWSNMCTVLYNANQGTIDVGNGPQLKEYYDYTCGDPFIHFVPESFNPEVVDFTGWTFNYNDNNNPVPNDYIVNDILTNVIATYEFDDNEIDDMILDEEYHLDIYHGGKFFKFTPDETTVYEILTTDISSDNPDVDLDDVFAYIAMMSADTKVTALSNPLPDNHNNHIVQTLTAGTTYYFQIREMGMYGAYHINMDAMIRKSEYYTVTYHANHEDVWFDDDETKITKEIPFTPGTRVDDYSAEVARLHIEDMEHLQFVSWGTTPDAEFDPEEHVILDSDIDLYAIYYEKNSIILDANGGYFPMNSNLGIYKYTYIVGYPFDPPFEPHNDDTQVKIAGWSRNPDATEPDPDILEMVTDPETLPRTLYAVYTEKILETFDANGGYLLDDNTVTTYESTKGIGHIFYGLSLFHEDPRMMPLGWTDQDDEFIPYTPGAYPYYQNKGDTEYTAVWGYEVLLDANGGIFPNLYVDKVYAVMPYEGTFSLDSVIDQLGPALPDNPNQYLIGWATTPDATTPDIIPGETLVSTLDHVYAVYGDDTYYFEKGEDSTWNKGNEDGLEIIIKRQGFDADTYSAFTYVKVDGEFVSSENYTRREGSLILKLKPSYLETLSEGEHTLVFAFGGEEELSTTFTISKPIINPNTGDRLYSYIYILIFNFIILIATFIYMLKYYKKRLE